MYDEWDYDDAGQPLPDFTSAAGVGSAPFHPDGPIVEGLELALSGTSCGDPGWFRFLVFEEYVARGMHLKADGKRKAFTVMAKELSGLALPGTLSKWLRKIEAQRN